MPQSILVSVVIPCFNHGDVLSEAVSSVMALQRDDVELIVVDDGSTDHRTRERMSVLMSQGIHVVRQDNQGLAAARNSGIRLAKGEFIVPLDSDNRLRESYLIAGVKILNDNPAIGVVYGHSQIFGETSGIRKVPEFDLISLARANFVDACALYRKCVWTSVQGYDEKMPWMGWEDWDFWLRAAVYGWGFSRLDEVTFDYRVCSHSMINNTNLHRAELLNYIFNKPQNHATRLLRDQDEDVCRLRGIEKSREYRLGHAILKPVRKLCRLACGK